VPRDTSTIRISPNWEQYRRRNAIPIKQEPEPLTSNWLRMMEMPDVIRYYEPTGAVDQAAMFRACGTFKYHAEPYLRGFFSFAESHVINEHFESVAAFAVTHEINTLNFLRDGWAERSLRSREATNFVQSISRKAWEATCRSLGMHCLVPRKNKRAQGMPVHERTRSLACKNRKHGLRETLPSHWRAKNLRTVPSVGVRLHSDKRVKQLDRCHRPA
jgi:hypothetical protein